MTPYQIEHLAEKIAEGIAASKGEYVTVHMPRKVAKRLHQHLLDNNSRTDTDG